MAAPDKTASIAMIASAFGANADEKVVTLWLGLLSIYDEPTVYRAAVALIRKTVDAAYGRMPLFGLMQQELDAITGAVHGEENVRLQAEAEWSNLLTLIHVCGSYREPELNRTTKEAIRVIGGWEQACSWNIDELNWKHRDFVQFWMDFHGREDVMLLGSEAVAKLNSAKGKAEIQALIASTVKGIEG